MKFHILSTSKREYSCESLNIYTKETDRLIGVENGGLRDGQFSRDNGKKSIWCRSRCNIKKHFCRLLTLQRNLWETTSAKKRMMAREQ